MNLMSSTLLTEDAGVPFHELQAEQIRLFREAWAAAGHQREPRVSVSRSIFALVDDRDRAYFGRGNQDSDKVGYIDAQTKAIFGRSYAAEPDVLVRELAEDTAIQAADTLLLTVPNQLGVEYNAHAIESILRFVAPELGWRYVTGSPPLDAVEDQVESALELVAEVVAGLHGVLGDEVDQVRVGAGRERREHRLGTRRCRRCRRTGGSTWSGRSRRCSRRGASRRGRSCGHVEAAGTQAADHGVVVAEGGRTGVGTRLHEADRPSMAEQHVAHARSPAGAWPPSSRSRSPAVRSR